MGVHIVNCASRHRLKTPGLVILSGTEGEGGIISESCPSNSN